MPLLPPLSPYQVALESQWAFGDLSKEKLSLVGYTCVLDIYYYYVIYIKYTYLYPTILIYIHIHVCVYVSIYLYVTVISMYV